MALSNLKLASGPGWQVHDVVCTSGPHERSFEEQHQAVCIAIVTEGTFQYRTRAGAAVLLPGALLLGSKGACFECGHEHATGDRCLSFHFDCDYLDGRCEPFTVPHLPPLLQFQALISEAEAARDVGDSDAFEEIAARLAQAVSVALPGHGGARAPISSRDERTLTRVLRRIEADAHEPLSLGALAAEARMSPFHFIRTFRRVTGQTPYQYLLSIRLHRAAVKIRSTDEPIGAIAINAGFNDLSTFNRRFRRLMGVSPGEFRARGAGSAGAVPHPAQLPC